MNDLEQETVDKHNARPGVDQVNDAEQCGSIVIVRNSYGPLGAYRVDKDGNLRAVQPA